MITFIVLTLTLLLTAVAIFLLGGTAIATVIVLFGDFIVCGVVIALIVKLIKKFRKRK